MFFSMFVSDSDGCEYLCASSFVFAGMGTGRPAMATLRPRDFIRGPRAFCSLVLVPLVLGSTALLSRLVCIFPSAYMQARNIIHE